MICILIPLILVYTKLGESLVLPNTSDNTGKESGNQVGTDDNQREGVLLRGTESGLQEI